MLRALDAVGQVFPARRLVQCSDSALSPVGCAMGPMMPQCDVAHNRHVESVSASLPVATRLSHFANTALAARCCAKCTLVAAWRPEILHS
jgi:hypothetical protein